MRNPDSNLTNLPHDPGADENTMPSKLLTLQKEFERGQQQMAALDQTRNALRDTLLRISGAIQVLEELLANHGGNGASTDPRETSTAGVST